MQDNNSKIQIIQQFKYSYLQPSSPPPPGPPPRKGGRETTRQDDKQKDSPEKIQQVGSLAEISSSSKHSEIFWSPPSTSKLSRFVFRKTQLPNTPPDTLTGPAAFNKLSAGYLLG